MSIRLVVEALDYAPEGATQGERLLLVALAEKADDSTRRVIWTKGEDPRGVLSRRVGVSADSLTKIFARLATRGCDPRVPAAIDKDGRPVFAYEGRSAEYLFPVLRGATASGSLGLERPDGETGSQRQDGERVSEQEPGPWSSSAATVSGSPERESHDGGRGLVLPVPEESHPRAGAVAALMVRLGLDLAEADAVDAVEAVVAKYNPDDPSRYMSAWPIEDVQSWARKARKLRKQSSAQAKADSLRCEHGMVNGFGVTGEGHGSSRRCGKCEVASPADRRVS